MTSGNSLFPRMHFTIYINLIFRTLARTRPNCLINQFPCEASLTVKDLLAAAVRLSYSLQQQERGVALSQCNMFPEWMPLTYNLSTELPHFIAAYQNRQKR